MDAEKNAINQARRCQRNWDYSKTVDEFKKIGVLHSKKLYSQKNKRFFLMILKKEK